MSGNKKEVLVQLQKDILALQGFRPLSATPENDLVPSFMSTAFPNHVFPVAAVHEFVSSGKEQTASASGFIAGLLSGLLEKKKVCVWIGIARTLFPPALKTFGIEPDQVIFIDLKKEKEVLWATEEALKCEGLGAVVAEIKEIDFTVSRRLQLAVEKSRVTGFILRQQPRNLNTIACVSRWRITSLASQLEKGLPGVGFPRWEVELLKIRNGRPAFWNVEWHNNLLRLVPEPAIAIPASLQRKVG